MSNNWLVIDADSRANVSLVNCVNLSVFVFDNSALSSQPRSYLLIAISAIENDLIVSNETDSSHSLKNPCHLIFNNRFVSSIVSAANCFRRAKNIQPKISIGTPIIKINTAGYPSLVAAKGSIRFLAIRKYKRTGKPIQTNEIAKSFISRVRPEPRSTISL